MKYFILFIIYIIVSFTVAVIVGKILDKKEPKPTKEIKNV